MNALERDGALLSEPSTMAALGAAISATGTVAELEAVLQRVYRWTEGELPLRGPALRALAAKAYEFSKINDRAQVLLWLATVGCSNAQMMLAPLPEAANCVEPGVAGILEELAPQVTADLEGETNPRWRCAVSALLMRTKLNRETVERILLVAQTAEHDDVRAGVGLLLGHALRSEACDTEQAEVAREFLRTIGMSSRPQLRCIAVVAEVLARSEIDAASAETLCESLTAPTKVEGVLGFGPHGREVLSTARYAATILRWVSVPQDTRARLVNALTRSSDGDLTCAALHQVAFGQTVVPTSGLTRESLTNDQVVALSHIAHHGSELQLAALRFGPEPSDVDEFLSGQTMPWRPVIVLPDRDLRWHYLKVARAVADGELSASVGARSWLDVVDDAQEALDCCLNDYWFLAELSAPGWGRHQDFVLIAVEALSQRGVAVIEQLEQAAHDGSPANSGLLGAALAQSYALAGCFWPAELDGFLSEAIGVAKVGQPLRRVLEQLPISRQESVLATYPALPFWDICLTVTVVAEMVEFARLFPEHEQDVLDCLRRGNVQQARQSLGALRSKPETLVERFLTRL